MTKKIINKKDKYKGIVFRGHDTYVHIFPLDENYVPVCESIPIEENDYAGVLSHNQFWFVECFQEDSKVKIKNYYRIELDGISFIDFLKENQEESWNIIKNIAKENNIYGGNDVNIERK